MALLVFCILNRKDREDLKENIDGIHPVHRAQSLTHKNIFFAVFAV
jgi:hypothetical protein